MNIPLLLAAAQQNIKDLPEHAPGSRMVASDMTLLLFSVGAVIAAIIFWAIFIRGPKKHPEIANRKPLEAKPNPNVTITPDGRERVRKKRRERRRDHRQRNPTLDQTGGLPPPRDPRETTPI
jgi:hypothetical protein